MCARTTGEAHMLHVLAVPILLTSPAFDPSLRPWEEACERGRGGACYALGVAATVGGALKYDDGRPVPGVAPTQRDVQRGIAWFRAGCAVDHVRSCAESCVAGGDEDCARLGIDAEVRTRVRAIAAQQAPVLRLQAIGALESASALRVLAWASHDPGSHSAVVQRLAAVMADGADQLVMAHELGSDASDVRRAALLRLPSSELGAALAFSDASDMVRRVAAARLGDPWLVHSLLRHEGDYEVVRAAVGSITDRQMLLEIALGPPAGLTNDFAARVALERIHEPADVEDVARYARSGSSVATYAVDRIGDAEVLARLAETAVGESTRLRAVQRIREPAVVLRLARNCPRSDARAAAIARVTDARVLAEAARSDPSAAVRIAAVQTTADTALLLERATTDEDARVRALATARIQDPAVLADLAWHAAHAEVRAAAAMALPDEALRGAIARTHTETAVRIAALRRLQDARLAADLAQNDSAAGVRRAASEALRDNRSPEGRRLAAQIARTSPDAEVRGVLLWTVESAVLREAAQRDPDPALRRFAAASLRNRSLAQPWTSQPVFALSYGSEGAMASAGVVTGVLHRSGSHAVPSPDDLNGLLLQADVGTRAMRVSVGVARASVFGPITSGLAVKGVVRMPWQGDMEVGGELEFALLARVTLGVSREVRSAGRTRVLWGVGVGF